MKFSIFASGAVIVSLYLVMPVAAQQQKNNASSKMPAPKTQARYDACEKAGNTMLQTWLTPANERAQCTVAPFGPRFEYLVPGWKCFCGV